MLPRSLGLAAVLLVCCLTVHGGGPSRARPELKARWWFNNPVYRINDRRDVVLFFFEAKSSRHRDDTARITRLLNRLAINPDVVVIGLTRDSRTAAQRFISKHKVRFTVGAGSDCQRAFGIKRLPALLRVARGDDEADVAPVAPDDLEDLLPDFESFGADDLAGLTEAWQLRAFVESDAPERLRRKAVKRLFETADPNEFVAFAAERLPVEHNPWIRARLEYYSDLARGIQRDDEQPTPSALAHIAYREDPGADEWAAVRRFEARMDKGLSAADLVAAFEQHASMEPADLVIRRKIATELGFAGEPATAREALLRLLPLEPDPSIRMYLAFSLSEVCPAGDEEAASLLEDLASSETNVLRVRPMLEYLAFYIRTGEEDAEKMPAPAERGN